MVAIDRNRIVEAIRQAERRTSGEIRVSVSRPFWGDVRGAAEKAFDRMGMRQTRARNGVLIFVVPSRRKFVVLGDAGIHEKVGQDFWEHVAHSIEANFRSGNFTEALISGIFTIGEQLAAHYPYDPDTDHDELPNRIE